MFFIGMLGGEKIGVESRVVVELKGSQIKFRLRMKGGLWPRKEYCF